MDLLPFLMHILESEDEDSIKEAIEHIQEENEYLGLDFGISNVSWLTGEEERERTGQGPLRIDFKTRENANAAIELGLLIGKSTCSATIFVPRPPQCYRCQGWGHLATDCSRDAQCGRCTMKHETAAHKCAHEPSCKDSTRCDSNKSQCVNCGGSHASWIHSCPVALKVFRDAVSQPAYATGLYEYDTPWTYRDSRRCRSRAHTN